MNESRDASEQVCGGMGVRYAGPRRGLRPILPVASCFLNNLSSNPDCRSNIPSLPLSSLSPIASGYRFGSGDPEPVPPAQCPDSLSFEGKACHS